MYSLVGRMSKGYSENDNYTSKIHHYGKMLRKSEFHVITRVVLVESYFYDDMFSILYIYTGHV